VTCLAFDRLTIWRDPPLLSPAFCFIPGDGKGSGETAMTPGEGCLVLVRHGQSTDNELNLFSGWRDPALTERGVLEARDAGLRLREHGLRFDVAFTSKLGRARRSLDLMLDAMDRPALPILEDEALNERHYGELSGLNKEGACDMFGAEQVRLWRKSYHAVPPGGESLAMTASRTLPFCARHIDPRLRRGECVLVVAHGNSLRSVVKHLDRVSDADVVGVHIPTSQILVYRIAADGSVASKTALPPCVEAR
jgi:2,3-bisphosphoglycerate-dependent phosphoglycerate mutase